MREAHRTHQKRCPPRQARRWGPNRRRRLHCFPVVGSARQTQQGGGRRGYREDAPGDRWGTLTLVWSCWAPTPQTPRSREVGSNVQQRPAVWTQAVRCKAGMGVPAGLLLVEGRAQGCGKIMQAMQRLLRQKGQMFCCERGQADRPVMQSGEELANRFTCAGIQILEDTSASWRYN